MIIFTITREIAFLLNVRNGLLSRIFLYLSRFFAKKTFGHERAFGHERDGTYHQWGCEE